MNTTENNKLIAVFMGFTLGHPDKNETRWKDNWFTTSNKTWGSRIEILHFDSDWNWLMEVVQKILTVGDDTNQWDAVLTALESVDITELYEVVVEFIKWYNQQK